MVRNAAKRPDHHADMSSRQRGHAPVPTRRSSLRPCGLSADGLCRHFVSGERRSVRCNGPCGGASTPGWRRSRMPVAASAARSGGRSRSVGSNPPDQLGRLEPGPLGHARMGASRRRRGVQSLKVVVTIDAFVAAAAQAAGPEDEPRPAWAEVSAPELLDQFFSSLGPRGRRA